RTYISSKIVFDAAVVNRDTSDVNCRYVPRPRVEVKNSSVVVRQFRAAGTELPQKAAIAIANPAGVAEGRRVVVGPHVGVDRKSRCLDAKIVPVIPHRRWPEDKRSAIRDIQRIRAIAEIDAGRRATNRRRVRGSQDTVDSRGIPRWANLEDLHSGNVLQGN